MINPERDSLRGRWQFRGDVLLSPRDAGITAIKISYRVPREYNLTVDVKKLGDGMIAIGLVTGSNQMHISLDVANTVSKFDVVDGKGIAFHVGRLLMPNRDNSITCEVRASKIVVKFNGDEIGKWEGAFRRLSVHPEWRFGSSNTLFLGSVGGATEFSKVSLTPVLPNRPDKAKSRENVEVKPSPAAKDPNNKRIKLIVLDYGAEGLHRHPVVYERGRPFVVRGDGSKTLLEVNDMRLRWTISQTFGGGTVDINMRRMKTSTNRSVRIVYE
jgi:hypothetical protein